MGTEVGFSMDDLRKKVAEDAQARFGALIPAEKFQGMIDAAIKEFFETPVSWSMHIGDRHGYTDRYSDKMTTPISPFKALVWSYLHKETVKVLDELFKAKENIGHQVILNALKEDTQLSDVLDTRIAQLAGLMANTQSQLLQQAATSHLLRALTQYAATNNQHGLFQALSNYFDENGKPKNQGAY